MWVELMMIVKDGVLNQGPLIQVGVLGGHGVNRASYGNSCSDTFVRGTLEGINGA